MSEAAASATPAIASAPVADTGVTPPAAAAVDTKAAAPAKAEAPKAEAVKAEPTKAEIRTLKLKLDGADVDLDEAQVIALAQQSGSAQKRFLEAAAMRKEAESVLEYLKSNPEEAMEKLGINTRELSEKVLMKHLEREKESPEAKKMRETEEKLLKYEAAEKKREDEAAAKAAETAEKQKQEANAAKEREIMERYDRIFTEALEKGGLPKNAFTVKRLAELQRVNLKSKLEMNAEQLAKIVKEDYENEFKARLPRTADNKGLDGDKLLEMLGPDIVKALTRAQIAKLKGKPQQFSPKTDEPVTDKPKERLSWREIERKNRGARS